MDGENKKKFGGLKDNPMSAQISSNSEDNPAVEETNARVLEIVKNVDLYAPNYLDDAPSAAIPWGRLHNPVSNPSVNPLTVKTDWHTKPSDVFRETAKSERPMVSKVSKIPTW